MDFLMTYNIPQWINSEENTLQTLAVGAFVAGAVLRGIMGGGIAAAIIKPVKAELYHIQKKIIMQTQPQHVSQSITTNWFITYNSKYYGNRDIGIPGNMQLGI